MSLGLLYFLGECIFLGVSLWGSADGPSDPFKVGVELCNPMNGGCRGACKRHSGLMTLLLSLQDILIENDIITLHGGNDNKSTF